MIQVSNFFAPVFFYFFYVSFFLFFLFFFNSSTSSATSFFFFLFLFISSYFVCAWRILSLCGRCFVSYLHLDNFLVQDFMKFLFQNNFLMTGKNGKNWQTKCTERTHRMTLELDYFFKIRILTDKAHYLLKWSLCMIIIGVEVTSFLLLEFINFLFLCIETSKIV